MNFIDYNREYGPLPQFSNLSLLKLTIGLLNIDILPTLLESCPNLKSLVLSLDFDPSKEKPGMRLSSVPRCLVSSLESVEIKRFNGGTAKMEVARYFVENSVILKKLVLRVGFSSIQQGYFMLRDLLALPRRSNTCQILAC
ncbi:unnamed protein product [Thlaspi arvense]|uniref:FBD domain-containing protein n=1 Tax=Thlaspi arvense TaxID=13288 RepID=A0AAU9SV18_THLAR|nr:unnamed protein product [Thlaspi arvense]